MSDQRKVLQSLFADGNRFANFGEILTRIHIQGFRCHDSTVVEISSPIAGFCGLNGTGKSTLLHLAAAGPEAG